MHTRFMRKLPLILAFFTGLTCAAAAHAQTGVCNDGTTTNATSKRGACSGHGGVKAWNGTAATSAPSPAPVPSPSPSSNMPAANQPLPQNGGGAGQVWVNTPSNVCYCKGDRYYGNTKNG